MAETRVWMDIVYSRPPQRDLRLDLRMPAAGGGGRPPLVLYIPMGGMRGCRKETAPTWLLEHGFAMASIECRVSSEVQAPEQVYDCKAAVRWLRAHAGEYGYTPEAIGVWGHSAGGLLAAMIGATGDLPALEGSGGTPGVSSRVQAVCDECGAPHDFTWFARTDIKTRFAPVAENLRLYLGRPVEDCMDFARAMSPATYVSSRCPPMLLIHGDQDGIVPVEETREFARTLASAGVDTTLKVLPGAGHGWDEALTRDDIVAFFKRTLRSS